MKKILIYLFLIILVAGSIYFYKDEKDKSKETNDKTTNVMYFKKIWDINKPLRSLGISVSSLSTNINHQQISLFYKEEYDITQKKLEIAIDEIRNRFGNSSIKRGISQSDLSLSGFNPKEDHTIHPVSYFR